MPLIAWLLALGSAAIAAGVTRTFLLALPDPLDVEPYAASIAAMAVLLVAAGLLIVSGLIVSRLERMIRDGDLEDFGPSALEIYREVGSVDALVEAAAPLFWSREHWIKRRVEQIGLLDHTLVRRRISIDFSIPGGLTKDGDAYWLPLTALRNWPPVLRFDLRDGEDKAVPLLSKATTNAIDEAVLSGVARDAIGQEPGPALARQLAAVVHGEGQSARRALTVLSESLRGWIRDQQDALGDNQALDPEPIERLLDLAGLLVDGTLLWIPVRGESDERRIVKLSYDEPIQRRLVLIRALLANLGLAKVAVDFDAPHVGDSCSYHLEVEAPAGMEIANARLLLGSDPDKGNLAKRVQNRSSQWLEEQARRLGVAAGELQPKLRPATERRDVQTLTHRAHMYVTGARPRSLAAAFIYFVPERRGVPTAAVMGGLLTGAAMTAFEATATDLASAQHPAALGSSVAFLLLAPGLLAYTQLRPAEHPFASRILVALRFFSVLAALLPVTAAALLLGSTAGRDYLDHSDTLMYISWALAALTALSWVLPVGRSRHRQD